MVDIRETHAGDPCPQCGRDLYGERVIEIGNIFQLGTKYSRPMGATYLDEQGAEHDIVMGSYGIGLARIAAAAVEQHHDDHGIGWPAADRSFPGASARRADRRRVPDGSRRLLYAELARRGFDVLFDDRDLSPGVKFKDADLLGCPVQVVVGKRAGEGMVELKPRADRRAPRCGRRRLPAAVPRRSPPLALFAVLGPHRSPAVPFPTDAPRTSPSVRGVA